MPSIIGPASSSTPSATLLLLVAMAAIGVRGIASPTPQPTTAMLAAAAADRFLHGEVLQAAGVPASAPAQVTAAPDLRRGVGNVLRRQTSTVVSGSTTFTLTIAPDETCGFLSASAGAPVTCSAKARCMWEQRYLGAIICGISFDYSYLRCLERDYAIDPSKCNDVCESNVYNLRCTNTSLPYCRTYTFPGGVKDYRCASTTVTAAQSVDYTYSGQTDRTFSTLTLGASTTPAPKPPPTTSTTTTSSSSSSSQSTAPPTPAPADSGSPSQNIPAIVGGSVGGLAVIALSALGIVFLMKRYRRNNGDGPATPAQPQAPPPAYPSPQVSTVPGGGFDVAAGYHGQPSPVQIDPNTGSPVSGYHNMYDGSGKPAPIVTGAAAGAVPYQGQPQPHPGSAPASPGHSPHRDSVSVMSQHQGLGGMVNHRLSTQSSGTPVGGGYNGAGLVGVQPATIQELGTDPAEHHHGQIHELR